MADQKRVTLRSGHADPKTIVLYDLPVADASSGTQIVLYEFHATPKTIVLRNPAETPVVGGTVEIALAATEAPDVFAGAAGLVAEITLAATEAPDDFAGTVSAVASVSLAATEGQDTFAATVEAVEVVADSSGVVPVASGGVGFASDRPAPPKHLTTMVFSNDPPRGGLEESAERADFPGDAAPSAEDGTAARPSSAPLSDDAARAIAAGIAAEVQIAPLAPMPELIAGNDDEEAMMIILALAA